MKKILILIISILLFLIVLLVYAIFSNPDKSEEIKWRDYSEIIQNNSSWITLDKSDYNSLLLKTYSHNILSIIGSIEEAVPVIVEVEGGLFSEDEKNNFLVVSAFASDENVYFYRKDKDGYIKGIASLSRILEDATRFFVIDSEEVLQ